MVPRSKQAVPLDRLVVGSRVFYPAHGVVTVTGVETRALGDERQDFYVLELDQGARVLLPTDNVARCGVRPLVSAAVARKLAKRVESVPDADDTPWRERTAQYTDALRAGSAEGYTETLRQLLFRSRSDKLTTTERRLLDTARAYFVSEIGAVLDRPTEQLEARLDSIAAG